ncbi:putative transcriptional acitvator, Baf family [Candidatus Ruthia magnifica str. Cm (Calyptogena magnifica)]|uniref:Type III pantothenate kinase n=1 Tax=Ruthia magnifica subsp. Calyptogena magnifica TaxID=413404 RepID=A1AW06_RUTMC|nr:type III pantothenate kinase [Candidatus Ruthturnera calyptogenae]ABL02113.1 putative transcriptional acitvator, Baf family [Candidatus Ruthia magnifica str. Cm (Calyptogena magnifica)]
MCQSELCLLVDIGNTAIKWRLNDETNSALIKEFNITELPKADEIFVSCVGDCHILNGLNNVHFVKTERMFKSLECGYQIPSTLGSDRWLAMLASIERYPKQNLLIIDAGTALTFDLVLANGKHQGGLIMPGLSVLRHSFSQFSSGVQQLSLSLTANNTQEGWIFGTSQMLMGAINTQIEQHLDNYSDLIVVLTCGDAKIIALKLHYQVKLHQNLVLEGLSSYAQTYKVLHSTLV